MSDGSAESGTFKAILRNIIFLLIALTVLFIIVKLITKARGLVS